MNSVLRVLLLSSVAAAASLPAYAAEPPAIHIGGAIEFQAGYADQDAAFEAGTRHHGFVNNTEVVVDVSGKADAGWSYGATIELEADVSAEARGEGLNADKTFLWFEDSWGRFELGNNFSAERTMNISAASIAHGSGGIDGESDLFINAPNSLIFPYLPTAYLGGIAEDATKITYYTPEFSGFQFGVSFTPDQGDGGQLALRSTLDGNFENVWSAGLAYEEEFNGLGVAAALVGESGASEDGGFEDLAAWHLGGSLSYKGFSVAGSYGDWGESGMATGTNSDSGFWSLGGAYAWGEAGVSVNYLNSELADNDYEALTTGADYALAPGLVPYAEVTFFDADDAGTTLDNHGTVLLLGTYLYF